MAVTHEDIQELKKVFDERYVQIKDCDNVQENMNAKFANDDKRIDRLLFGQEQTLKDLKKNNWLTTAILTVIIGIVITLVINKAIGG